METVLVTGGSGFVGSHLINFLLDNESIHKVISVDIVPPKRAYGGNFEYINHDVRTPLKKIIDNCDCIVNLAAVHKSPGHPAHEYFETNILGACNVCQFARDNDIKKIVFTSSISVYGPGEDEKSEESIQMPNIPYGSSKAIAEYIHREWMLEAKDRQLNIIRPAVIFGKGEGGNFTRIAKTLKKNIFVYPGRTDTIKAWVYVKDVCLLILHLIDQNDRYSLFNCCYPRKTTTADICKAFHHALGYKMPKMKVPLSVMKTGAGVLKKVDTNFIRSLGLDYNRILKLVNSTNISSKLLVSSGFRFEYDLEKAIKDWSKECGGENLF